MNEPLLEAQPSHSISRIMSYMRQYVPTPTIGFMVLGFLIGSAVAEYSGICDPRIATDAGNDSDSYDSTCVFVQSAVSGLYFGGFGLFSSVGYSIKKYFDDRSLELPARSLTEP